MLTVLHQKTYSSLFNQQHAQNMTYYINPFAGEDIQPNFAFTCMCSRTEHVCVYDFSVKKKGP